MPSTTCVMKEPHAPNQTSSLRILVGDDQVDVLEALRLLLKGAGYQTGQFRAGDRDDGLE